MPSLSKTKKIEVLLLVLIWLQALLSIILPVYKDTNWIRETWFGNDLVTLIVVCPLYLFSLTGNSRIKMILNVGSLGYVIYNYAFYVLGAHLNAMFLLYLIIIFIGILLIINKIGVGSFANELVSKFNTKKKYGYSGVIFCFIGVGLGLVWISMWFNYIVFGAKLPTDEPAFRLVASLDLLMIVSSMIISGIGLIRKHKIGFILGSIIGVQGFLYLLVLTVNSIIISVKSGELSGELSIWGSLLFVEATGVLVLIFKKN